MKLWGGIEAGGTKFVCAIGTGPDDVRAERRFPTGAPAETLQKAVDFFREQQAELGLQLDALGVASFGPVDPNPRSPTFGYITTTPKPGWSQTDVVGPLRKAFDVPIGFDTDVNGAALAEYRWGAARGLETFIYLTIGTGIGGGVMAEGRLLHGLMHPEMGHVRLPHDWEADPYPGFCPFHGDCFEGLAAGPALEGRWEQPGESLPPDHEAWALEARYISLALMGYVLTLAPQRIILGGGVMQQRHLFPMVRSDVQALLNGYIQAPEILEEIESYIVPPALGGRAGVLGAFALAEQAARNV